MDPENSPKARSERLISEASRLSEEIDRHLSRSEDSDDVDAVAEEDAD